eukprot:CAMPEP_0194026370 /NCGR_PEP_ID=MMETSP0009_2-20130614/696_1 /TAXON_ID=210454 /ORGANISM="Grammatophora oceanica, Strain CCMP 410" /LENGTH=105 /DNA_ID=CAMNT_0038665037 /DNA_START=69 /DNA_END=386 /DNA_ORIENTATION=-
MVTINADSANLSRRYSNMSADDDHLAYCQGLASKIGSIAELPAVCQRYPDVVQSLKSPNEKVDPFAGMKSRTSARAARNKGQQNYAQIQRRFTSSRRFSKNSNKA